MVLTEWTDTFCVAGLAWWLVLRERHRGWATFVLTLGLASKPSVLLLMVPLLFWTREARREVIWAVAATAAIVAPFAIWTGIPQFVYDTVGVFGDLPVRPDGVTFDGLAAILGHAFLPGGLLVAGIAVCVAVFTLRRPRDYGSLLAAGSGPAHRGVLLRQAGVPQLLLHRRHGDALRGRARAACARATRSRRRSQRLRAGAALTGFFAFDARSTCDLRLRTDCSMLPRTIGSAARDTIRPAMPPGSS